MAQNIEVPATSDACVVNDARVSVFSQTETNPRDGAYANPCDVEFPITLDVIHNKNN